MTHNHVDAAVATIGIDIGKNTFHLIGFDARGAIILRSRVTRGQLMRRFVNLLSVIKTFGTVEPHG